VDIVDKSGSWYSYAGDRIGQGRENAKAFLTANPDICRQIEEQVLAKLKADRENAAPETPGASAGGAAGLLEPEDDIVRVDADGVVLE